MADQKPLDILVVSQFFSPEMGAPAARFHDFGRLLLERGHRMTVLTGFPNFPSSIIHEGYRGKLFARETIDGIDVRRGWVYASPKRPTLSKSMGYASFALTASLRAMFGGLKPDVVVATSPPPTVAIPGMVASRLLRAPLLFDVRDIWPEAVVESGRLERGMVVRSLESIERAVYRASSAVTVVTEGKRVRLMEKGVPEEKLAVIPNGVDLSRFDIEGSADDLLAEAGVDRDRFLVIYAGIFGPSQGLDVIFDAALRIRKEHPQLTDKLQFVLVGGGVEKERLLARLRDDQLEDLIKMVPEQPREMIPPLLRASNAIAVTLRPRLDTHTVPSKIYESMASRRPVLVSANGAPREILEESGAGYGSAASDADALAANIVKLAEDPAACTAFGEKGRAFSTGYDRRHLVQNFEAVLQRIRR